MDLGLVLKTMKHGVEGCVFTLCAVIFASNGLKVNRIASPIHVGLQSRVKEQGGEYGSRQVRKDVYAF
jgi:hypothetical protein